MEPKTCVDTFLVHNINIKAYLSSYQSSIWENSKYTILALNYTDKNVRGTSNCNTITVICLHLAFHSWIVLVNTLYCVVANTFM